MSVQVSNNAIAKLAVDITSAAQTIFTVEASYGALFPSASIVSGHYFYSTLINEAGVNEVVKVVERVGDTFTVLRGQDGTAAIPSWLSSNTKLGVFPVAAVINDLKEAIEDVKIVADSKASVTSLSAKADTADLTAHVNDAYTAHQATAIYYNPTGSVSANNVQAAIDELAAEMAGVGALPTLPAFASGTRMPFNQTYAPVGWTKLTNSELNDSVMRIVTGSVGSGGTTAFSAFNSQSFVNSHTLTANEIPNTPLQIYGYTSVSGYSTSVSSGNANAFIAELSTVNGIPANPAWKTVATNNTIGAMRTSGGNAAHTHAIATAIKYNDFIICEKA